MPRCCLLMTMLIGAAVPQLASQSPLRRPAAGETEAPCPARDDARSLRWALTWVDSLIIPLEPDRCTETDRLARTLAVALRLQAARGDPALAGWFRGHDARLREERLHEERLREQRLHDERLRESRRRQALKDQRIREQRRRERRPPPV